MPEVAPGIITNGLGGSAHNMIAGFFHLGPIEIIIGSPPEPPEPPIPPGGGPGGTGGMPGARPWEDRTDAWDKDHPRSIIIRIKWNDKVTEKIYHVSAKRAKFIIAVTDFLNKTRERYQITVSNVKRRIKAIVSFKKDKD
jgi:hypothetical protein